MEQSRSFTIQSDNILPSIQLQVGLIATPPDGKEAPIESVAQFVAIINTAVVQSRIAKHIVARLGLEPLDQVPGIGKTGLEEDPRFQVDLYLPNQIRFTPMIMGSYDSLTQPFDCIIGMDILRFGDLSLSHVDGRTMFSFRVPSIAGVDYVKEHESQMRREPSHKVSTVMTSREQPCPCGSGKKYKNCCGKLN